MERLEAIYKKSYNFVYLRAKSILKKEEDIQQLMKEVYGKLAMEDVAEDKLYEWLGKEVYIAGCNKFRQKKVREVQFVDLEEQKYEAGESVDREQTKTVICEALENLPDMYQATVFALCYDHMKIKDIVAVMGYNSGAIINRLNYVNKYLEQSVENYREEQGGEVQFSVELLCEGLAEWCKEHQMTDTVAQNIYASICREQGIVAESICEEGENAGLECRVNGAESEGFRFVCEELQSYAENKRTSKKPMRLLVGIGVVAILMTAGVLLLGEYMKKDEKQQEKPAVEQEKINDDTDEQEAEVQMQEEEVPQAEVPQEEVPQTEVPQENTTTSDAEYILPKSDKEKLTRADLEGLTKEQLRLARNEIYARHGMIFGVSDLDNYFATKSWYKPTIAFGDFEDKVEMSILEEQNIVLIQQVEKEK